MCHSACSLVYLSSSIRAAVVLTVPVCPGADCACVCRGADCACACVTVLTVPVCVAVRCRTLWCDGRLRKVRHRPRCDDVTWLRCDDVTWSRGCGVMTSRGCVLRCDDVTWLLCDDVTWLWCDDVTWLRSRGCGVLTSCWHAGIGRITMRLPSSFADEVVGTVLDLFRCV